ncbi:MAG TPA: hypothetical protein VGL89_18430 [Candidatus Koribacter sp.]|jgi:hypothetical protein
MPMTRVVVFFLIFGQALWAEDSGRVAIAFLKEKNIVVADSSGDVVRTIPAPFKKAVSGIAVDASGTQIVAVVRTFGRGEFGGDLYLWTVRSKTWKKITEGPYVFKKKEKGHREVYDDPAFGPDGKSIAFVIHYESLFDDNDAVDAVGPAAFIFPSSGKVDVIHSTLTNGTSDPTGPPWLANSPRWSPNGKLLLLSFEDGFATVELGSGRLHFLKPNIGDNSGTYGVDWVNSSCVLFLAFFDDPSKVALHALNVKDDSVAKIPGRFGAISGRLLDFNSEVWVAENSGVREVHGRKTWELSKPGVFGLAPNFAARDDEPRSRTQ